jgi:hypothetical protein
MSDHIPDPGQHRTLFYGEYSNRVRGAVHRAPSTREAEKPPPPPREVLRVAEHGEGWGVPAEWE